MFSSVATAVDFLTVDDEELQAYTVPALVPSPTLFFS